MEKSQIVALMRKAEKTNADLDLTEHAVGFTPPWRRSSGWDYAHGHHGAARRIAIGRLEHRRRSIGDGGQLRTKHSVSRIGPSEIPAVAKVIPSPETLALHARRCFE